MHTFCFTFLILFAVVFNAAGQSTRADSLILAGNYRGAIDALDSKKEKEKSIDYIVRAAYCHVRLNNTELAEHLLQQMGQQPTPKTTADFYYRAVTSLLLFEQGVYSKALAILEQAIAASEAQNDRTWHAIFYHEYGNVLVKGLYHYFLGFTYLDKAHEIYKSDSLKFRNLEGDVFFDKSVVFLHQSDWQSVRLSITNALERYEKNAKINYRKIAKCKNQLSIYYGSIGDFESNKKELAEGIALVTSREGKQSKELHRFYGNMGVTHWLEGDLNLAISYYRKALSIQSLYRPDRFAGESYLNMGECLQGMNKMDSALFYYRRALAIKRNYYNTKHPDIAVAHLHLGDFFMSQSQLDSALQHFQLALINQVSEFNSVDLNENPVNLSAGYGYSGNLMYILSGKAKALFKMYQQKNDTSYLIQSFNNFVAVDQIIHSVRNSYEWEESRYYLSRSLHFMYEDALAIAFELYSKHGENPLFIEKAFQWMESSKQLLLLEQIRDAQVKSAGKDTELLLKKRIAELKIAQYLASGADHLRAESLKRDLLQAEMKLQKFYDSAVLVQDVKMNSNLLRDCAAKLDEETALMEYFVGERMIYSVGVMNKKYFFAKEVLTDSLKMTMERFFGSCSQLPDPARIEYELRNVDSLGYILYARLLGAFIERTPTAKRLRIVPDGIVSLLPMDVFPSAKPSARRKTEYLIDKLDISYSFSYSIEELNTKKEKKEEVNLLAVVNNESGLQGATDELQAIEDFFNVKAIKNSAPEQFVLVVPEYSIVHIATHSRSIRENPLASYIQLTNGETGRLYAKDLYGLDLKADLVVLASCESGSGSLLKGEGIYSLARGFVFAGSTTVVMSNWKVPDMATAVLMKSFYAMLSNNKSIGYSLAEAKRKFRRDADQFMQHPFYWAGFQVVGQAEHSPVEAVTKLYWFTGGLFLLIVVLILYRRKKAI